MAHSSFLFPHLGYATRPRTNLRANLILSFTVRPNQSHAMLYDLDSQTRTEPGKTISCALHWSIRCKKRTEEGAVTNLKIEVTKTEREA